MKLFVSHEFMASIIMTFLQKKGTINFQFGRQNEMARYAHVNNCSSCLKVIPEEREGDEEEAASKRRLCLVTASNDGLIKAWSVERRGEERFEVALAASQDTKCRITCMAVHKVGYVQVVTIADVPEFDQV